LGVFPPVEGRSGFPHAATGLHGSERAYHRFAESWCTAVEAVDPKAKGHSARVGLYASALAERVGIATEQLPWYRIGGLLHDVGKAIIPVTLLTKPGALTAAERREIERHPVVGAEMVEALKWPFDLRPMVLYHHERWDGGGYPHGLARGTIPLSARIMAIADVFDALTSERPYRPAYSPRQAIAIMTADSGGAFDPQLFEAFREMMAPQIAQGKARLPERAIA
jgi:putative nucleotidyltransferase with HDIG domain